MPNFQNANLYTKKMLALEPSYWWFHSDLKHYLANGANPNAKYADGKTFLHTLIEKGVDIAVIQTLIAYGVNIHVKTGDGHNAASLAFENNNPLLGKYLQEQGAQIPAEKLNSPYLQAVNTVLVNKHFTKANFLDVHVKNKAGGNLLHLAATLNDDAAIKKLLSYGVNPLVQDNTGLTPLKLACSLQNDHSVKAIVNHYLEKHQDILKYSDFSLFKAKNDGITLGGFYYDTQHEKWLLKEGHYGVPEAVVKEYVAGGLYQLFLGENAPQTEIVIDNLHGDFLLGSKLLKNFSTLADFNFQQPLFYDHHSWHPYGENFPVSVNGKPVEGFMDAIWAINFVRDTDAHGGNVGLIDKGDHYNFAKIDHGFTFNFSYFGSPSLDDIRSHLKSFYQIEKLEVLGFDTVFQSLTKISHLDFSAIENLITEKMSTVKEHMEVLELKNLNQDYHSTHTSTLDAEIKKYQSDLVGNLKSQHQQYQKIENFMLLEKAIIDHDGNTLLKLMDKGVSLTESFKPFYNPTVIGDWWNSQTLDVNGYELGKKYWGDVFKPGKGDVINFNDIFPANNNQSVGFDNAPAAPMMQNPLDIHMAPVHMEVM